MIAAVILAAGAGRRLGTVAKALLEHADGTSFLARIAGVCRELGVDQICVVVAEPHRARTEAEAERLGLSFAHNPHPERGMSSSVAVGFAYADARLSATAALLWPVDHARVNRDTVARLVQRAAVDRIAIPTLHGRGGHPTLFGRQLWPELARCDEADDGARSVVRADPARVDRVPVTDIGVRADVDTPADLIEVSR